MTVDEADWSTLEAERHPGGVVTRRLFPRSPHDILLAVQQPSGRRMLVLRVPATAADTFVRRHGPLPSTRGLSLSFTPASRGRRDLQVVLTDRDRREVFNPLVGDIAEAAQAAPGPVDALVGAVQRYEHWCQLLQILADTGLSPERRRGLYGELVLLDRYLLPLLGATAAVTAWTGPAGTHQDFQLPHLAIEVKTGAGRQSQTLTIANERQLDDTGVAALLLAHVSVDERRGGSGQSLNGIVDTIRDRLPSTASAILQEQLLRVGYLPEQRDLYDEPRYTTRTVRFWRVTSGFPRIIESDLRPGVGECTYRISTAGLDQYLVPADRVAALVGTER